MTVRAVCFDLGGVVARITHRWSEMLHRAGVEAPVDLSPTAELDAMPTFRDYQAGLLTDKQYLHDVAVYLGGLTFEQAKAVHAGILIEPYAGVADLVSDLNERGIVTGCLSNTNAPHWQDLATSGRFPAIQMMQVRLASFQIGANKPDPLAFTKFEEAAGVEPKHIVLFDDSLQNCEAARSLGWSAEVIDPSGEPAEQMRRWLTRHRALRR